MILNFKIIISDAENIPIPECFSFCAFIVLLQKELRYLTLQTGGKTDKPFAVFFKQIPVYSRLKIKSLSKCERDHFYQIFISCFIFNQQDKMIIFLIKRLIFIKSCSRRNINLTSDYRLNPLLFTLFIKIHCAVHITVVGYCKRGHPQFFSTRNKPVRTANAIEKTELRMKMKMSEHNL